MPTTAGNFSHRSLTVALALAASAATALAGTKVFTTDADFQQGALDGIVIGGGNLTLGSVGSTFPVLWVANAGEDTVSKIDTRLNREVARYRTWFNTRGIHGAYDGPAPSRTTVDTDGNVFVLNRQFDNGKKAVLIKILATGGIDRNNNGVIDTSSDLNNNGSVTGAEVLPLVDTNGNGVIDPGEIQDERIAWAVEVGAANGIGRAACIGTDGNVWVGLYSQRAFYKVNGSTGATMSGPHPVNWTPYGCAVDRNGILYSATLGSGYGRLDTNNPTNQRLVNIGSTYGIAIGENRVYLGGNCSYYEVNATTESSVYRNGVCNSGLSVDVNGDIVTGYGQAAKYSKTTGAEIWRNTSNAASYAVGVVADGDGNVWQVDYSNNRVSKFNGATGAFMAQLPVGTLPYTYSDATGIAARTQTTPSGFWSVILDGGANNAKWYKICWQATVPAGAAAGSETRADNNQANLGNKNFEARGNCTPLVQEGRFLELRAKLTAAPNGGSPVVGQIAAQTRPCDVDGDGDVDQADLNAINAALNTNASSFSDARDANSDGKINVLDVRACTQQCTRAGCATN
jgi:hypothetical protein